MAGISATIKTGRKGFARGVERRRERSLRIVPDSGAQLRHHAGKVVTSAAHPDRVHCWDGLVDPVGFPSEAVLTVAKSRFHWSSRQGCESSGVQVPTPPIA